MDHGRSPRPKPDPEVFLMAMRELGVDAGECWIIEDSLNGIVAGKAAGCFTVGITTTFDADKLRLRARMWSLNRLRSCGGCWSLYKTKTFTTKDTKDHEGLRSRRFLRAASSPSCKCR